MRADIINLGCSKNLVDSEKLMTQLRAQGVQSCIDPIRVDADVLIINTCGFILDARQESIDTILAAVELRKQDRVKRIIVMGCLVQRYADDLRTEIPEIDAWFGVDQVDHLLSYLDLHYNPEILNQRRISTPKHYAFLKVSEGCSRKCAFCSIPSIRGKHVSRPVEEILSEAAFLAASGVREILLIAQDLSYYGRELYHESMLVPLLEKMSGIEGLKWIRLHYTYPEKFPEGLIGMMGSEPKICRYLDMPFQHISDKMLKRMKRGYTRADTLKIVEDIRKGVPGVHIRTSLIVGHPGETEKEYAELLNFVRESRFERLGVFKYSQEDGTFARDHYKDDVPEAVKQDRYDEIMETQRTISGQINRNKVGQRMEILIDRKEGEFYVGRSEFDSPEVDQEILVSSRRRTLKTGVFYPAEIVKSDEYDLYAVI